MEVSRLQVQRVRRTDARLRYLYSGVTVGPEPKARQKPRLLPTRQLSAVKEGVQPGDDGQDIVKVSVTGGRGAVLTEGGVLRAKGSPFFILQVLLKKELQ